MLSSVLNSERAVLVNIKMNAELSRQVDELENQV
jgi:hypothetical protein